MHLTPCSLAITASPTPLVRVTTFWRQWFFLFSTPSSSWWGWLSMASQFGCFYASHHGLILSYTWRILWLQMLSWLSHSLSRFVWIHVNLCISHKITLCVSGCVKCFCLIHIITFLCVLMCKSYKLVINISVAFSCTFH